MSSSGRKQNLVILGMHRSGTSMVSGALVRSGFHAGDKDELMSAGADNPRGFWERRDVVAINDKLLSAAEATWFYPAPVTKQVVPEISQLLEVMSAHSPWLIKDPRMIFTWSAWASALKTAAKLFVYRSPLAVAASLKMRHGFPLEYGLDLWEIYNRQAIKIIKAEGGTLIHYEAFSHEPKSAWEELHRRLDAIGVSIDLTGEGLEFDQQLDHSVSVQADESRLTPEQRRLHTVLLRACESGELPKRLPARGANFAQRLKGFGEAYTGLAEVAELRAAVERIASERDQAREHFQNLEALRLESHEELASLSEALQRSELEQKEATEQLNLLLETGRVEDRTALVALRKELGLKDGVERRNAELEAARQSGSSELVTLHEKLASLHDRLAALNKELKSKDARLNAATNELADSLQAREVAGEELRLLDIKLTDSLQAQEVAGEELRLLDIKLTDSLQAQEVAGEELRLLDIKLTDSLQAQEVAGQELSLLEKKLADSEEVERQLEAKADYLFGILDTLYRKLLAYRKKPIGRFSASILMLYKLITLRPRLKTGFDDILNDAGEHVVKYPGASPLSYRSRAGLVFLAVSAMVRHPVRTIKYSTFSGARIALSVFLGTNRDELESWVQTRFPTLDGFVMPEVKPDLEPVLDSLELSFPSSGKPRVSIVIPVYNEYRMTIFCLQSLLEKTTDIEYEVILADDTSTDLTSTIGERIKGIRIVRAEENQGFVNNCRSGASHARGEYVLFLNNDTAFTDEWLSHLVAVLDADPSAGIAGPMLLFGNGRLQEAGGIIWQDASGWNFGRADDPASPEYNYVKETDYISGACLLIRHKVWKELGGFDQRFVPAYYEDTDLCFAVRAAGHKVVYQPASRVYHFEGVSNGTDLNSGVKKHQVVNKEKFLEKWADTLQLENFANAQRVFFARDRSRDRRTVLVIDHYVPTYDMDAGSRSTWLYLQLMVEMGYNVKFLGANFFPHQPYTKDLQSIGIEVLVGEKISRGFPLWLKENAKYIDTVYVHRPHIAKEFISMLHEMNPKPKLIYFGHDLHFLRVEREYALTGDRKDKELAEDWKRRELALFEEFDKIYYPSQVEVDVVTKILPELDISVIPLYVIEESEAEPYRWKDRTDILFVGGFNHPPNVDAIHWFVEEILPLVIAECPDIKLNVVGSKMPAKVKALASKHVVIHGYLTDEELAEQYRQAKVVAVPLRFGAGVKGKVLEALQQGVPLVTTPIGAEGLPEPNVVFNIKETAADFAQELIEIERGSTVRLAKLDRYSEYLDQYFSKSRAREILCRDFGDPKISREWL